MASESMIPKKLAPGLDPGVGTGFPPSRSPFRRAKEDRKRSCANEQLCNGVALRGLVDQWRRVSSALFQQGIANHCGTFAPLSIAAYPPSLKTGVSINDTAVLTNVSYIDTFVHDEGLQEFCDGSGIIG